MIKFVKFANVSLSEAKELTLNPLNRVVDDRHTDEIKRGMVDDFYAFDPIKVNIVTNHILDGQHRHKAFVELMEEHKLPEDTKLCVRFVEVPPEEEVSSFINANTNSKNWTTNDFFNVYYSMGTPSYVKLHDFCLEHLCTQDKNNTPLLRYAGSIIKGKNVEKQIREGRFVCTDEELEEGHKKASELEDIMKVMGKTKTAHWFQCMAQQWSKIRGSHSFSEWIRGFKYCTGLVNFNRLPYETNQDWFNIFSFVSGKIKVGVAA